MCQSMCQIAMSNPEKQSLQQDSQEQEEQGIETSPPFDDLVVDRSLAPVIVSVIPTRTGQRSSITDDDLLIELQCEV